MPNVVQVTYRNAASSLRAVGLEVGNISYRNNIGKDMVLALRFEGDEIDQALKSQNRPKSIWFSEMENEVDDETQDQDDSRS